jgi:NADPH:quinone reductase-like Zn-dependent oxidoreductase
LARSRPASGSWSSGRPAGSGRVLDAGGHRPLRRLRRALTPQGTLVIVGSEGRGRWLGGFDRNLRAVLLSRFVSQRLRMLSSEPRQEDLQTLRSLAEAGKLTPVVDRGYPLAQVPDAMRHLVAGHVRGKLVITV